MNEVLKEDKIGRVLQIYAKLADGYVVKKTKEAQLYGVNERSITRDIEDIRSFLDADTERTGIVNTVVYDRETKGYRLETLYKIRLQNSEILALCKILLDSRAEMVEVLDERFHIPYNSRFEEGEFRKRIQFMYGGRLQKVKFQYSGTDIDAILDRLSTAEIMDEQDGVYTINAEVFGTGINMWLKSQGDYVKVIK
jgi:hypothetical protein